MSLLVDTNIFSELVKPTPDSGVIEWAREHQADFHVTTITIGELKYGIAVLEEGKRKEALQKWLKETCRIMEGRTLSFNRSVAYVWADLRASMKRSGHRMPLADSLIAATAKRHQLAIATRNVDDFNGTGIRVVNPFD